MAITVKLYHTAVNFGASCEKTKKLEYELYTTSLLRSAVVYLAALIAVIWVWVWDYYEYDSFARISGRFTPFFGGA